MIQNSDLSCEVNTGCIDTLKHVPESCNLDVSNTLNNAKNGPVWVNKLNYYRWPVSTCDPQVFYLGIQVIHGKKIFADPGMGFGT